jgi:hypothetical protein
MVEPGTCVVTELKFTGLKPAPKPPVPEEVVVPPNVTVPTPSMAEAVPPCVPVAPPAALPPAVPPVPLTKPDPPLVLVNSPDPDALETPLSSPLVADPLPPALPPPVAVPVAWPPEKLNSFLDPLRYG